VAGDGIETLLAALRRSLWILLVVPLVGIAAMNAIRQYQGPQYEATARVVLSPTDIAASLTGTQAYVDPERLEETELALADSQQLFERVAAAPDVTATTSELRAATSVDARGSTISYSAVADDPDSAREIANAVASVYPEWRADVSGAAIEEAIEQIEDQIAVSGRTPELVEQLNRLSVLQTLTSGNVLLVEPAATARKTRPSPIRDSIVGFLLGLFLALLAVAVREVIDTGVRSEAEVEELLAVPLVGTIERLPRRVSLVTDTRGGDRYEDMYALLAAHLAQAQRDDECMVVAITSATATEGKTTTAANLATAFARRGKRVAVVDLDGRRPMLGRFFHVPQAAHGIEQVLANRRELRSALWNVSLDGAASSPPPGPATGEPARRGGNGRVADSLLVVPMQRPLAEAAVRHRARVGEVLDELRKAVDFVVIDTPPALATADMTELAKLVDVALIVVRHRRVSRRTLGSLGRVVRTWAAPSTAAVLVGAPRQEASAYYYGR